MFKRRFRRYRYNRKRTFLVLFLFVGLYSISLGYSLLNVNIGFNGVTKISKATWDVHFASLSVDATSVTAITPAKISATDPTSISFSAQLDNPGDRYTFTFDVVNNGTISAEIDSIVISPDVSSKKYLQYTVTYSDGTAIKKGDVLNGGGSKKIKVDMKYVECEYDSNYPSVLTPFNIEFKVNYKQHFA